jgi:hypothetical protein
MTRRTHSVILLASSKPLERIDHDERGLALTMPRDLPAQMESTCARGEAREIGPKSCRIEWPAATRFRARTTKRMREA